MKPWATTTTPSALAALPTLRAPAALRALPALAAVAALVVVPACGSDAGAGPPTASSSAPDQTVGPSAEPAFNPTDVAWIQLMVAMDEQLLRVLAMATKQAALPSTRALATQLSAGHRAELIELRRLRVRSGAPAGNPHEGHDMPGMMTETEIAALGRTPGTAFDRLFEPNLREHLKQSIVLAKSLRSAGHEQATRALAAAVEQSRTARLRALSSSTR